jgi:hypothetical protein
MLRREERKRLERRQLLRDKFACTSVHRREALKLQQRQTRN